MCILNIFVSHLILFLNLTLQYRSLRYLGVRLGEEKGRKLILYHMYHGKYKSFFFFFFFEKAFSFCSVFHEDKSVSLTWRKH